MIELIQNDEEIRAKIPHHEGNWIDNQEDLKFLA